MSSIASWSYVVPLTIWPVTYDEYSQVIYGAPYLIIGDWIQGDAKQVDSNGSEFIPMSTYYFEAQDGSELIPSPEDYILRGDNLTALDPIVAGAEKIKKVGGWNMQMFGANEIPDWAIWT